MPLNKKVVENHFNNEMNVDIEMFTDNASVEVVAGYVNFESVWVCDDEKIVREIGHNNEKMSKTK